MDEKRNHWMKKMQQMKNIKILDEKKRQIKKLTHLFWINSFASLTCPAMFWTRRWRSSSLRTLVQNVVTWIRNKVKGCVRLPHNHCYYGSWVSCFGQWRCGMGREVIKDKGCGSLLCRHHYYGSWVSCLIQWKWGMGRRSCSLYSFCSQPQEIQTQKNKKEKG